MWSGRAPHRALQTVRDTLFSDAPRYQQFRRHLYEITAATTFVIAIGTVLVYLFERDATGTQITNFGDALCWTTAQALTISSAMPNPLSTGGRIVDVFLMGYGVVFIGAVVAVFNKAILRAEED